MGRKRAGFRYRSRAGRLNPAVNARSATGSFTIIEMVRAGSRSLAAERPQGESEILCKLKFLAGLPAIFEGLTDFFRLTQ